LSDTPKSVCDRPPKSTSGRLSSMSSWANTSMGISPPRSRSGRVHQWRPPARAKQPDFRRAMANSKGRCGANGLWSGAPSEVEGGYEETAQNVWVPAANDPTLPRDVDKHPMIYLIFAGPDDPRPGVSYSSLAPGRIILIRAR
jgi:hypothetical protein